MLSLGTRVRSTYSPNRIVGEIVGYGSVQAHTLDAEGRPIEFREFEQAYLVRLDKMIVDEKTDNTFRAVRVVVVRQEFAEEDL